MTRATLLRELVTAEVRMLQAYQIPHPHGIRAKLDANESPYGLPPAVAAELGSVLGQVELHRYPDGGAAELRRLVAADVKCDPAQLCFGNGSDELIALIIATFSRPRPGTRKVAGIAYPVPSFVVYRIATLGHGALPLEIPLRPDFTLDPTAVDRTLVAERPNVIFFALPNNPTGTLWPRDEILRVVEQYPDVLVIADEAYFDYAGETLLDALPRHANLVIMRTFSKVGLAALRCGYLIADPDVVGEIEKIRPPYNVGSLNQAAVAWLLANHPAALRDPCRRVVAERERVVAALSKLADVHAFPTRANFVLMRHGMPGDGRAGKLWTRLCERGVLVRNFDRPGPLSGCLRVTIGTPEENDLFLGALAASI